MITVNKWINFEGLWSIQNLILSIEARAILHHDDKYKIQKIYKRHKICEFLRKRGLRNNIELVDFREIYKINNYTIN